MALKRQPGCSPRNVAVSKTLDRLVGTMRSFMIILILCAICPAKVWGSDTATGGGSVELVDAKLTERTIKGELDACELTYTVAFEDHIYRRGEISFLRGAISLLGFINVKDKGPAISFKITGFDLINGKPTFAPLGYAYLSAGSRSFAKQEYGSFQMRRRGMCLGYDMLKHPDLLSIYLR